MSSSFREALEKLVEQRIAAGEDPRGLFEELMREANLVFGHYKPGIRTRPVGEIRPTEVKNALRRGMPEKTPSITSTGHLAYPMRPGNR